MAYIDLQDLLLLRLEAMRSVLKNDAGYTYRSICRWYSQNFNTPLHEVGTPNGVVPMEDVLQTFYETRYSEMDDGKKETELMELLMTPEEELEEARRADVKEAEDWMFARLVEKQELKKKEKERLEEVKLREQKAIVENGDGNVPKQKPLPAARLDSGSPTIAPKVPQAQPMQSERKPAPIVETNLPENVKIVFMTDEEMENEASLMDPMSIEKSIFQKPPKKPAI